MIKCFLNFARLVALALAVMIAAPLWADQNEHNGLAGKVVFATGDAFVVGADGPVPATMGVVIKVGDRLVTGSKGYIHLRMVDGAFLGVRAESSVNIDEYQFSDLVPQNGRVRLHLQEGTLRAISGTVAQTNKQNFRLNTPVAAIGVRGTDFVAEANTWQTKVAVSLGGIAMAPFGDTCLQAQLGPCDADLVTELFAHQAGRFLALERGEKFANLLGNADGQFAPGHPQEQFDSVAKDASQASTMLRTNQGEGQQRLSYELTTPLKVSLDADSSAAEEAVPQELVQIDSIELIKLDNKLGASSVFRQKLDRKVVDIADQRFDIVTQDVPLIRYFSEDGQLAWGSAADASLFDTRLLAMAGDLSYSQFMTRAGVPTYLQAYGMQAQTTNAAMQAWDKYYQNQQFTPITQLGGLALYHSNGVQALTAPVLNTYLPYVNIDYTVADVQALAMADNINVEQVGFTINYQNRSFVADIAVQVGGEVTDTYMIKGLLSDSGMLVGGHDKAYMEGVFLPDSQQIAMLLRVAGASGDNGFMLLMDQPSVQWPGSDIVPALALYQTQDQEISWGRWQNFEALTPDAVGQMQLATMDLMASNSHFALFRSKLASQRLPETGQFAFTLQDYEAIYNNAQGLYTADLNDASLNVDFVNATFVTSMQATSVGMEQSLTLTAQGSLDSMGAFSSTPALSNMQVDGFVGDQAASAGMLIEYKGALQDNLTGALIWSSSAGE